LYSKIQAGINRFLKQLWGQIVTFIVFFFEKEAVSEILGSNYMNTALQKIGKETHNHRTILPYPSKEESCNSVKRSVSSITVSAKHFCTFVA